MQRSRVGFIKHRMTLNLGHATSVELHWSTLAGGTVDPTTGSKVGAVATPNSETVKGFVHFTNATTGVRQFMEIEMGDCIVELPPDTTIEGRPGLHFKINGERWTQKTIAGELAKTWDAVVKNVQLYRVLLLSKAK